MNVEEFNARIAELTVGTRPKDRRELLVSILDECGTYIRIRPVGKVWELVIPVGDCVVCAGQGRYIKAGASHRTDGMMRLAIGDAVGYYEFRIRGFIEFPADAGLAVEEVEG